MKNLFQKGKDSPYSLTEEVSKSGFYWTVLHYASHYGHYDVDYNLEGLSLSREDRVEIPRHHEELREGPKSRGIIVWEP